ncbi:MAG TPA: discoidin domain-containing protein [Polyangiaceae bacterium]
MIAQDSSPALESSATSPVVDARPKMSIKELAVRYFLMRDAIESAKRGYFKSNDPGFREYRAARQCLEAGQSLAPDVWLKLEGIAILRQAFPLALTAWKSNAGVATENGFPQLWKTFAEHPIGKQRIARIPGDALALVEKFVDSPDMLYVVELSEHERALLGQTAFALVSELVKESAIAATSVKQLQALRVYRLVLAPAAVIAMLSLLSWWFTRPVNLALNKPVQLSSSFQPEMYPPQALVNGDTTTLGIHTMHVDSPWAQVDLGSVRKIRRVVVFNRQNIPGNSVPLQIDTSVDGKTFERFAYNPVEFLQWKAEGPVTRARYVRLTVKRVSSLQLCEVEVY